MFCIPPSAHSTSPPASWSSSTSTSTLQPGTGSAGSGLELTFSVSEPGQDDTSNLKTASWRRRWESYCEVHWDDERYFRTTPWDKLRWNIKSTRRPTGLSSSRWRNSTRADKSLRLVRRSCLYISVSRSHLRSDHYHGGHHSSAPNYMTMTWS